MRKKNLKRIAAATLACMMMVQSADGLVVVNAQDKQVRSQSSTQMASDKEVVYVNAYDSSKREHDFDANWKFYLGDATGADQVAFDDSKWETVSVPHDYSIEQEYTKSGEAESAYLFGGTGWYRKHFTLSSDMQGKEIRIDFGGVYMDSTVWVNGHEVGTHPFGYTPFSFDITDYVTFTGENIITVKVNHQTPSSRWYSGSGIYRSVSLTVMDKVHVDLYGTQITTPDLKTEKGGTVNMNVATTVANEGTAAADVVLTHTIYEKGTKTSIGTVTTAATSVAAGATVTIDAALQANNPQLWGLGEENAHLYTVTTEVKVGDAVVDTYDTEYGFRYYDFSSSTGFSLNGESMKLKGVCMHHDQGSLGAEAHYRAIERQVELLQEMGCNAIRVTHNPAADELIEICNEKGMMLIEEMFDGWMYAKNGNTKDYARFFNVAIDTTSNEILGAKEGMTWSEFDLTAAVKRGRNAASIIMWSIGNEVWEGAGSGSQEYVDQAARLANLVVNLDTSRPVTNGDNKLKEANQYSYGMGEAIDAVNGVVGANYCSGAQYDQVHTAYPDWAFYGAETASHINSRGVYDRLTGGSQTSDKQLTSYDRSAVGWGAVASSAWYDVITRDYLSGEFVWTGFDYLGEPTPWNGTGSGAVGSWESPKNSYFGIIDTAGLPKDNYYFYQSQWNEDVTTLHVLPAWNEDVVVAQATVPVVVYSDAAAVELFFTDDATGTRTSLGKKEFTTITTTAGFTYQMYEGSDKSATTHQNMYLTWNVAYQDGTIEAVAYDKAGNVIADTEGRSYVTTTGEEAVVDATVDRTEITADGKDLAYITVDIKDTEGNIVPDACNNVKFIVEGDGVLVGVDNGKQADHQSYQDDNRDAYNGSLIAIVQSTKEAGSFTVKAQADGLTSDTVTVTTVAAESESATTKQVNSFLMSKNYYVKAGNTVELPKTIVTRYTDGTEEELTVVWDAITETTGTFAVNGVVDGTHSVTVMVNVIDEIGGLLNYSTTTPTGIAPTLPESRPAVLVDGEILDVSFPVTWEKTEASAFDVIGTVCVNGTANVLGQEIQVTASVRVQEQTYQITGSLDTYLTLTQDIEESYQSDTLTAIWDGSTAIGTNTNGGANATAWTNYANSQSTDGHEADNTAEIVFEYATEQMLGEATVYFFEDSYSARIPDAGTTEIYVSPDGSNWVKVQATETIGETTDRVTPYKYTFSPVAATFIKYCITNKDETLSGRNTCTGITEIEMKKAVGGYATNSTAQIASLSVNEVPLTESEIAKGVYYTLDSEAIVDAVGKDNAAVTVLPAYEGAVVLIIESEDHFTRTTFTIYLEQDAPMDPADDSNDYPVSKLTAYADSIYSGNVPANVLDGNTSTIWHTNWSTSEGKDVAYRWIGLKLESAEQVAGIRYVQRTGNGDVTEYKVQYKLNESDEWADVATGTWDRADSGWRIVQFATPVQAKYIRVVGVHTWADSGEDAHMSTAELRVVLYKECEHTYTKVVGAAEATCTQDGYTGDTICKKCKATIEKGNAIAATGHAYADKTTEKATTSKEGKSVTACTTCGDVKATKTIAKIKSVTLSKTSYAYNGKTQKPTVKVKDEDGKTINAKYYTVKYASGCKKVGKYTVKITFKGDYSGTVKKTFTINPKAIAFSKVKAAKKAISLKWKKQTTEVTGYQIQYATNKSFTKGKKVKTVKKAKTTSLTLKKLSAKKTYYVRIRTYKTVSGKKYYSAWSAVKKVKTK